MRKLFLFLTLFYSIVACAQWRNEGTIMTTKKAISVDGTVTFGDPSGTSSDPTAVSPGEVYWNDTLKVFRIYNGTTWEDISLNSALSTGILTGGELSVNAIDPATFDVGSGTGYVIDHTVIPATVKTVTWPDFTGVSVTNLATSFATDIAINASGQIVQQDFYTNEELRSVIILGGLDHSDQASILNVFSIQVPVSALGSSIRDFAEAVGDINVSGNIYSPNGANMNIDKSAGSVFSYGNNYVNNKLDPHIVPTPSGTAVSFGYVFNDGAGNASFTVPGINIDPNSYDDGDGVLGAVPVNNWSIQRVLYFSNSNKTFVQYGPAVYNKIGDAIDAISTANFLELTGIGSAKVRAYIVVKQGETALNSADTYFYAANKFGTVSASGSTIDTSDFATLSGDNDFTGSNTFTQNLMVSNGSFPNFSVYNSSNFRSGTLWSDNITFSRDANTMTIQTPTLTGSFTLNIPDITQNETIATLSDVNGFASLTGNQTFTGTNTFSEVIRNSKNAAFLPTASIVTPTGHRAFGVRDNNNWYFSSSTALRGYMNFEGMTSDRTYTFPDASGTLATTSDLGGYAAKNTLNTFTGINIFNSFAPRMSVGLNFLPSSISINTGHAGFGLWSNNNWAFTKVDTTLRAELDINNITGSAKVFSLPDVSGNLVVQTGTSVDNQIGVFTGNGTMAGEAPFTYNAGELLIGNTGTEGSVKVQSGGGGTEFRVFDIITNGGLDFDYPSASGILAIRSVSSPITANNIPYYSSTTGVMSNTTEFTYNPTTETLSVNNGTGDVGSVKPISINVSNGTVQTGLRADKVRFQSSTNYTEIVPEGYSNYVFTLPAESGTAKLKKYEVYTALISQTGTSAPTVKVLENTLSGAIVWTRNSAGDYTGTLTSAFTVDKTAAITSGRKSATNTDVMCYRTGANTVSLLTTNSAGTPTDAVLVDTTIEIRVYP